MSKRRVVVTGLGIVSPVGSKLEAAWDNIKAGRSGINRISADLFDASAFSVQIAGNVKGFNATDYIKSKDLKKMDTFIHYGIGAGIDAFKDSGLEVTEANAERIGVLVGSGIGGLETIERNYEAFLNGGSRKISPFFVPSSIINMVAGNLSIMLGLKGPNMSIVSACASATHSIGDAARMIAYGDVDAMLAGGAEMGSTPLGIGGFAAARALSIRNDAPELASRPWDRDRDGFVLGDGAGILMLEEYEHAKARGARIYCELIGYGMSSDAYHMTSPSESGEGAARCMRNALRDAGINADQVGYVNAHGTSTPAGDKAETQAVKAALGNHAYKVAVSSTKSMTGHLLGAAGGVEAVFSVLALRDQVLPPTINLENPDPECDLDYVPNVARETKVDIAMSNSFGFGGTNGTLIFKCI
ncbi:MAG: beta-ketoacyl-ACP synthase II [Thiofilum sp.]|uniref:beta-ketoacyl-ACP synthase II n=1 Tax=Thiofilum sp. TaxID=2212733 RepID=UPI0025F27C63|nr:beta-ketoacyl-ACP synthase II [Thiofilum sp.]MBK8454501.1 beta-ketoacyl-ACP synthase II [Thiofilum sp.]